MFYYIYVSRLLLKPFIYTFFRCTVSQTLETHVILIRLYSVFYIYTIYHLIYYEINTKVIVYLQKYTNTLKSPRLTQSGRDKMGRSERIQPNRVAFRYLLIAGSTVIGSAVIFAMFTPGQDWVNVGDGRFFELWNSETSSHLTLIAVMAPIAMILVLGVYWLQRLFGEYQAGCFLPMEICATTSGWRGSRSSAFSTAQSGRSCCR